MSFIFRCPPVADPEFAGTLSSRGYLIYGPPQMFLPCPEITASAAVPSLAARASVPGIGRVVVRFRNSCCTVRTRRELVQSVFKVFRSHHPCPRLRLSPRVSFPISVASSAHHILRWRAETHHFICPDRFFTARSNRPVFPVAPNLRSVSNIFCAFCDSNLLKQSQSTLRSTQSNHRATSRGNPAATDSGSFRSSACSLEARSAKSGNA